MDQIDTCTYYVARARTERARALDAATPIVASVHAEMARLYEDRAAQLLIAATPNRAKAQAA